MKDLICIIAGAFGAVVAGLFGGWSSALTTLVIFMAIDYVTGLLVAGVFHKSSKSLDGCLDSYAGWKGLVKKGITLLVVAVAYRLDVAIGTSYLKDAVVIAFTTNELISITENAGLMGIPIPQKITDAIELLKDKSKNG